MDTGTGQSSTGALSRAWVAPCLGFLLAVLIWLTGSGPPAEADGELVTAYPMRKAVIAGGKASRAPRAKIVLRRGRHLILEFRLPAAWQGQPLALTVDPVRNSRRGLAIRPARVSWRRGLPSRVRLRSGRGPVRSGELSRRVRKQIDPADALRAGAIRAIRISAVGPGRVVLNRIPFVSSVADEPEPPEPPAPPEPPEPPETVTISAVGDIACSPDSSQWNGGAGTATECRHTDVRDLVSDSDDAVLLLGDVQYPDGTLAQFQAGFHPSWGDLGERMRPTPGNHEYYTSGAAGYFDYFADLGIETGGAGDGYYAFDLGDWTFLSLNSNCSRVPCEAGSEQERWLREQLAEARLAERCTLAFWHHPRASSGSHGSQSRVADLWAAFVEQGGDLVLAGHDHHYERFGPLDAEARPTDDGPISWVVGTGGKSLRSASPPTAGSNRVIDDAYGLIRMDLGPDSFEWEWAGLGDEGADSGTGTCRS